MIRRNTIPIENYAWTEKDAGTYFCSFFSVFGHIVLLIFLLLAPLAYVQAEEARTDDEPRIALVLQGGGALGIAHIGVIKIIEELGIPIDIVVGTSMGSIIGGLYSIGYTSADLESLVHDTNWLNLFFDNAYAFNEPIWERMDKSRYFSSFIFDRNGIKLPNSLLSDHKILSYFDILTLSESTPSNFDSFPRQFRAVAADVATGERVVLSSGSLPDAMRASMGIPGIFAPYYVDGRYLIDGGIVDNLPIDVARELGADFIIAIQLSGTSQFSDEEINRSPFAAVSSSIDILIYQNIRHQLDAADYVLHIDLDGYQAGDFLKSEEILTIGEETARSHLSDFLGVKQKILDMGRREEEGIVEKPSLAPVDLITVKGGDEGTRVKVHDQLRDLVDQNLETQSLLNFLSNLNNRGNYQSLRLSRFIQEDGRSALNLRLGEQEKKENQIMIGYSSASTYSDSINSKDIISAAFVFRGLFTSNSKFTVGFDMNAQPGLSVSFLQPLGQAFYLNLGYSASTENNIYLSNSLDQYSFQFRRSSSRLEIGFAPSPYYDFIVGYRHDTTDIEEDSEMTTVPMLTGEFNILTLDSFIFPQSGIYFNAIFNYVIPNIEESHEAKIFETSGSVVIPCFIDPVSFELEWQGGTDFSIDGDDTAVAPSGFKPSLRNRRMFPGEMYAAERTGSYVAGMSVMGKYHINWRSKDLGVPIFALLHGAMGYTFQNRDDIRHAEDYRYWNADWGMGIRLNDAFGIMLRVGMSGGFVDDATKGFVAVDIGSFGVR
ncbi:patatin-like phospholipase family protein [Sediminispirochaeta smaragdinae]|uniref:Patatin n=1 Tax=Sediminispirochaeta smaragdinae (strain DSM 11293 / JCM 15392 / SEBR 4228) TaxID=573413 RepID=E1R838_SEDSS|nr:patatin-like phospholipase family protein [Sediminispirochaeta smaragdinae]ADK82893.1 Patatin [Sediminispirochaeta smaragdinae DSM 11293]